MSLPSGCQRVSIACEGRTPLTFSRSEQRVRSSKSSTTCSQILIVHYVKKITQLIVFIMKING